MKKLLFLFSGLLLSIITVNANNSKNQDTSYMGYGNSFIFEESGVEFSIFPDGQFDFFIGKYHNNISVSVNTNAGSFSFNSGYNYNAYVQYDEFGAIIQIENTPVFYDYYGRVSQIGNVYIHYNNYGYVHRVGGLYVHYKSPRVFSHFTGFINVFNRGYVYRPWHSYYRIPARNYCVVYNRPYRRYYEPTRYIYNSPFTNNYRRSSAVASRRGHIVRRSSALATRGRGLKRADYSNNYNRRSSATRVISEKRNRTVTQRTSQSRPHRINTSVTKPRAVKNNRVRTSRTRPNKHIKNKSRTYTNKPTVNLPRKTRTKANTNGGSKTKYKVSKKSSRPNVSKRSKTKNLRSKNTASRSRRHL
jgi:hypothetical protein